MAWIGAGSADAFFHFGIHCWDMAAGTNIGVRMRGQEGTLVPRPPWALAGQNSIFLGVFGANSMFLLPPGNFCPPWKKVCGRPWVQMLKTFKVRFYNSLTLIGF